MDHTGKVVIPIEFGAASAFSEGLAAVRPTKEQAQILGIEFEGPSRYGSVPWGYIDQTGKYAIAPQYGSAGQFSEGLAYVTGDGIDGFIDHTGHLMIDLNALRDRTEIDMEKLRANEPGSILKE